MASRGRPKKDRSNEIKLVNSGTVQRVLLDLGEANPKQKLFFESRTLYTGYGGARGGGKSWALRTKAVGGAVQYPGIRILIVRKTYPELQSNHIEPICSMVPQELGAYNAQLRQMRFINGSIIKFGHFQGGIAAEDEYQGQEYDWIFMDEATQFTERQFRYLGGILRGVNRIPKRFFLTCNPGGVGHRWVKRLFIDRDFKTGSPNPEENENPDDYSFIFATVEDNTHLLESSPGYVQMLSALPENIRRAHRYGDWNALSGAYFPELRSDKHMVADFLIPETWQRYRAFDYGLDMFACGWFAVDPEGHVYMYREIKMPGQLVSEAAALMRNNTLPNEHIITTFAPPDMWSRQKDSGKTMAELFMQEGISIVKASNNRVQGWLQVKEMLKDRADGQPGLMFFSSCGETFGDLQAILTDDKNPNDCAKEPHDVTHAPDMVRYFCISRTLPPDASMAEEEQPDEDELEDYESFMTGGTVAASYMNYY